MFGGRTRLPSSVKWFQSVCFHTSTCEGTSLKLFHMCSFLLLFLFALSLSKKCSPKPLWHYHWWKDALSWTFGVTEAVQSQDIRQWCDVSMHHATKICQRRRGSSEDICIWNKFHLERRSRGGKKETSMQRECWWKKQSCREKVGSAGNFFATSKMTVVRSINWSDSHTLRGN